MLRLIGSTSVLCFSNRLKNPLKRFEEGLTAEITEPAALSYLNLRRTSFTAYYGSLIIEDCFQKNNSGEEGEGHSWPWANK